MKKINFNHDSDEIHKTINIPENRMKQLRKALGHANVEGGIEEWKKSQELEYVLENFDPKNDEELLAAGLFVGLKQGFAMAVEKFGEVAEIVMEHHDHGNKHPLSDILKREKKRHES